LNQENIFSEILLIKL